MYIYVGGLALACLGGIVWKEDKVKEARISLSQFNYEVDDHTFQTQHTTYCKRI